MALRSGGCVLKSQGFGNGLLQCCHQDMDVVGAAGLQGHAAEEHTLPLALHSLLPACQGRAALLRHGLWALVFDSPGTADRDRARGPLAKLEQSRSSLL